MSVLLMAMGTSLGAAAANASEDPSVGAAEMVDAGDSLVPAIMMPSAVHDDDGDQETTYCKCESWGNDCEQTCGNVEEEQTEGKTYACCWQEQKDWKIDECHCDCKSGPSECTAWMESASGDNGYSKSPTEEVE